jgi:hypothetical protein
VITQICSKSVRGVAGVVGVVPFPRATEFKSCKMGGNTNILNKPRDYYAQKLLN